MATLSADGVLTLSGSDLSPDSVREAWFIPATWGIIDDLAPQKLSVAQGELSLALKPGEAFDAKAAPSGVLAIKDPEGRERDLAIGAPPPTGALEVASPPDRAPADIASPAAATNDLSLLSTLVFAFLGGLILNLMPCVFPILAVKAMTVASFAGRHRSVVRSHAAAYTLGVLAAFAALAATLIALRTAGAAAGWGFQFQSPAFVAVVAWLLFAIGLNLSGVFEIGGGLGRPRRRADPPRGGRRELLHWPAGRLVATPCTAPFMGAAVAAAATAPPATTLLIFLAMGLGLASPYGAFALAPQLSGALPRARTVDAYAPAGAGLSDVRRGGVADLGS